MAYAFEPSIRAAAFDGPNAAMPAWPQVVDEPGHQRRLGTDHDQVHLALARDARPRSSSAQALHPVGGDAGVARRGEDLGRLRAAQQRADERVLAPAAAHYEDPGHYSAAMKSSTGIAVSVS